MYKSRYQIDNQIIAIAIDSGTGEILEFSDMQTGENILKNSSFNLNQPFEIKCTANSKESYLSPPDIYQISANPELAPVIEVQKNDDHSANATVTYRQLICEDQICDISVKYSITLKAGENKSNWRLQVKNDSSTASIDEVRFPCLNGVFLGDSWENDILVYPYNAGVKIENPVESLAQPSSKIYWNWQEYRYEYPIGNFPTHKNEQDLYVAQHNYSGALSMLWLDYYEEDGIGVYFGCHDASPSMHSLRFDTYGVNSPGINFSFLSYPEINQNTTWESADFIIALHHGDWHSGARIYQEFRKSLHVVPSKKPDWFEKSAGLIAHYDFKYQNGKIVHTYKDIPKLYDEAVNLGISHLLFSGWHKDGFDNGFPEYVPDSELGDENDLKEGIKKVKAKGGHPSFYINSRLANTKYDHLGEMIDDNVVITKNGTPLIEQYGSSVIEFASMCSNSVAWQQKLDVTATYITEDIGSDGLYLDQLSMATSCLCYNKNHNHSRDDWNKGYLEILVNIIKSHAAKSPEESLLIMGEGLCDSFGPYVGGQLISTFFYHHFGAFPELYRYTFPEQVLIDMLYPSKNLAMRPVHIAMASTEMIHRAFITGCYYWIYDLVDDNTFTRDPPQYTFLKSTIALRKQWLAKYGHGIFKDTDGIVATPDNVSAKLFEMETGILIASACREIEKNQTIVVNGEPPVKAVGHTNDNVQEQEISLETGKKGEIAITLPEAALSIIYLQAK